MNEKIVILHQGIDGIRDPMIINACKLRDGVEKSLKTMGYRTETVFMDPSLAWIDAILASKPDLIFNGADLGFHYDNSLEPNIPAVLDAITVNGRRIPYTGSTSYCMYSSSDKLDSKILLGRMGIPVPLCYQLGEEVGQFPLIVKYRRIHNSEGITDKSIVYSDSELEKQFKRMKKGPVIAEQYIEGPEVCTGFITVGGKMEVLPPVVFDFGEAYKNKPKIRDFKSKWDAESSEHDESEPTASAFSLETLARLDDLTKKISEIFDIRDYGRLDFRLRSDGEDYVPMIIDINANPDITTDGTLYKMAKMRGYDYISFVGTIIESALYRGVEDKKI